MSTRFIPSGNFTSAQLLRRIDRARADARLWLRFVYAGIFFLALVGVAWAITVDWALSTDGYSLDAEAGVFVGLVAVTAINGFLLAVVTEDFMGKRKNVLDLEEEYADQLDAEAQERLS